MAFSKITIDFGSVPLVDEFLAFSENNVALLLMTETFKEVRSANYQVTLPIFEPDDGIHPDRWIGNIATNFKNAFNLDYNTTNLFTVETILDAPNSGTGSVIITANYNNAVFAETANNSGAIITIENQVTVTPLTITSTSFLPSASPPKASTIAIQVDTNMQVLMVTAPITYFPTTNPFYFEYARGTTFTLTMHNADGYPASKVIRTPDELKLSNTTLNIINTPSGATVSAVVTSVYGLTLQYSLDNINWQSSNLFSGIADGSYVMYIKEQYGYTIQKPFTVSNTIGGNIEVAPYFIIPIPNSIRFAQRYATKKNINTTLSNEEPVRLAYCATQKFLTTDIITTQVKTSYSNLTAYITDGITDTPITIAKKTEYIGAKDKRDGDIRRRPDGNLGVSFISGNLYNYDTNAIIGTYDSEGNLPAWASVESFFYVPTIGYLSIYDIVRDETDSFWEIVAEYDYTGVPFSEKVSTIYNAQGYDVYEFNTTMLGYKDKQIQVVVEATNNDWEDVGYISEIIEVRDEFEHTVEVEYWNDTNVGYMYYQTGIVNKMIHDGLVTNYKPNGEQDVHLGDTKAILVDTTLNNTYELIIFEVTTAIVRQIAYAMSHKFIRINDLLYVANSKIDAEKIGEHTNLYNVKVTLIEAGNFYSEEITVERAYGDLIGLLTAEYDYLKI